jgi:hypothetical protein
MPWLEHGTSRIYYEESGSGDPVLLLPGFSDPGEELTWKAVNDAHRMLTRPA